MFEINQLKYKNILEIEHLIINHPITCIIGPSGSGKSTLLRHLNGLLRQDSGSLLYHGENISQMDSVQLRRRVVMLGQTPVIYEGNIEDNLQIGLEFSQKPFVSEKVLLNCLKSVGLNKNLKESCNTLSGGEKQRLCLARVLLMDAETYLMDEPSSSLDKETEAFIIDHLVQFVTEKGKQLILVTHSESIASKFPNSIIRIENGKVGSELHE